MKRFQFSLQPVLTLREQKEQQAQQVYAQAVRVCEDIASRIQLLRQEIEACWATEREELLAGTSALVLAQGHAFLCALEDRQKTLNAELKAARARAQQAWQALVVATRDRDALDHFRDKMFSAHQRNAAREEQKFLDELAGRMASGSRRQQPTLDMEFA